MTTGDPEKPWAQQRELDLFHKFKIGQEVGYSPPRGKYAPRGMYLVTRLLPERDGQFEYFIKASKKRMNALQEKAN